ncbi:MAG: cytidine deaminase [Bacteroidia bacterium]|nr:MAG: cytidine deaminase [Bacteroidia bacterium]
MELRLAYTVFTGADGLPPAQAALLEQAQAALPAAYAPYSRFSVGAAVLLSNGRVVRGANQENVAYPSGLCAERVALFAAFSQYPEAELVGMAIAARDAEGLVHRPVTPCGACRQVLAEYLQRSNEREVWVLMAGARTIYLLDDARMLLPLAFGM